MGNEQSSGAQGAATTVTDDSLPCMAISAVSEHDVREWTLKVKRHYNMPVCFIALTSGSGSFLKGRHGIDTKFVDESSICRLEATRELPVIMSDILVVPHCRYDALVMGPPYARFYVGAPLALRGSRSIGTLCIMDTKPRDFYSLRECEYLVECGGHIAAHLTRRLEDFCCLTMESLGSNVFSGVLSTSSNERHGTLESLESLDATRPGQSHTLDSLGSFYQAGTRDELETMEPIALRRIDERGEDLSTPACPSVTESGSADDDERPAAEAAIAE
mmetsp:Transcript_17700/g.48145  ORF Transcript_17700/g.48145 Transcript_17700/m.48145 type:complete len:275 (-) Transcript_17700:158-982(-)